jgi:hypothetical protein
VSESVDGLASRWIFRRWRASGRITVKRLCAVFTAVWSLLGAVTCALLFAVSLIPIQPGYVRSVPAGLNYTGGVIGACMLPLCMLIPVPLLIAGRRYLRRSQARTRRVMGWTASASAGTLVEALFLFKLFHHDALIPYRSWHVLELSVGFLAAGAAMAIALLGTGSPTTRPRLSRA